MLSEKIRLDGSDSGFITTLQRKRERGEIRRSVYYTLHFQVTPIYAIATIYSDFLPKTTRAITRRGVYVFWHCKYHQYDKITMHDAFKVRVIEEERRVVTKNSK